MAGPAILIAAFSGRAAAMAARRAGFVPLVADLFADEDTCAVAGAVRPVAGDLVGGFDEPALLLALSELAAVGAKRPIGLVYGAGFEDRTALLGEIAARWPLIGNSPETVAAVKDPWRLAEMLSALDIPHPQIRVGAPAAPGWLAKRRGGAGGAHVMARPGMRGSFYAQEAVSGRSVSALFLAGPGGARIVGFSEQWTAPAPGQPYRFGGAVAPADIPESLSTELTQAVRKVARTFGLKGLNSIDFIVGAQGWSLIEINPRLGATLDLFDLWEPSDFNRYSWRDLAEEGCDRDGCPATNAGRSLSQRERGPEATIPKPPLFAAHIAAARGEPLSPVPSLTSARALQIVYALAAVDRMPRVSWPPGFADRPQPGTAIPAGSPVCTVLARGENTCEARRLCLARAQEALQLIGLQQ